MLVQSYFINAQNFSLILTSDTSISTRSGTFDVHKHKHKNERKIFIFLCFGLCASKVPLLALILVSQ